MIVSKSAPQTDSEQHMATQAKKFPLARQEILYQILDERQVKKILKSIDNFGKGAAFVDTVGAVVVK